VEAGLRERPRRPRPDHRDALGDRLPLQRHRRGAAGQRRQRGPTCDARLRLAADRRRSSARDDRRVPDRRVRGGIPDAHGARQRRRGQARRPDKSIARAPGRVQRLEDGRRNRARGHRGAPDAREGGGVGRRPDDRVQDGQANGRRPRTAVHADGAEHHHRVRDRGRATGRSGNRRARRGRADAAPERRLRRRKEPQRRPPRRPDRRPRGRRRGGAARERRERSASGGPPHDADGRVDAGADE